MNESRISRWLIIGAMLVAAPRYVGVNANAENWLIVGHVWQWVVALSGLGMAVLEGVAVWYCWQKWGSAKSGPMRNVLLGMIVSMLVAFAFAVGPYTYAASDGKLVKDAVSEWLRVVWAGSVSVAPFVVMAASGLAEMIGTVDAQEAQGEAGKAEQVFRAMLANFEARINATMSNYVTVSDAQMAFDRLRQTKPVETVEPIETKATESETETAPLLVSGETWQAQAVALARKQTETEGKPNYTHIAQAVGKTRTAVAAVVKAQLS